jgi:hypothetical protein
MSRIGRSFGGETPALGSLLFPGAGGKDAVSSPRGPGSASSGVATPPGTPQSGRDGGGGGLLARMASKVKSSISGSGVTNSAPSTPLAESAEDQSDPDANWVDLRAWCEPAKDGKEGDVKLFRATRHGEAAGEEDCILAVLPTFVIRLRVHLERPNFARIEEKRLISTVLKITSKKSVADLVIFHFKPAGHEVASGPAAAAAPLVRSYVVQDSRACIELVKSHYMTAKPLKQQN